jgi:predicted N-acyltransferase
LLVSKHHKPSTLKTRITRRINDIPAEDWNKVYPDKLESYELFKTFDDSSLSQFSLFYIVVYDRKTPVGAASCFLMDYSLDTSVSGPLRRLTNSIRKLAPGIFSLRALVCGSPVGQGRIGLLGDKDAVLKAILCAMERIAKKNKAAIIAFKDINNTYTELFSSLKKKGFSRLDSLPSSELNIRFKDFEGYLNTLSSESRYGLRRKFKKVDGCLDIETEVMDSLGDETLAEAHCLYVDVDKKHGIPFETMPIEFFKNISKNMPGRAKFFLWRIDGKLVKFLLALVSDDTFIDYYVGFDYSVAHRYHLYFLGFRDTLNWCIKNNIKRYEMGVTGYETKRRLGFGFVPLYIYAKLRNRALAPVFKLICQFLKFENFDPDLKKIKK